MSVVAIASAALSVLTAAPTSASGSAHIRIVDDYPYGRIDITINGVTRRLGNGDRARIDVVPDAMGNDGITVRRVKDHGCGIAKIGNYFRSGHHYRVRVNQYRGGRCTTATGRSIGGPSPHVTQVD